MSTKVTNTLRIKPVAYNWKHEPDPSLIIGETFTSTKPMAIFCSHPIPKKIKTYLEVKITEHPANKRIRHVPIYLGAHKEPSPGILCNDVIAGAAYYTFDNLDYRIFERGKGNVLFDEQKAAKIYAKIPIVDSVIGLGADPQNNQLSIFVDGDLFYSFSPKTLKLNDSENWFFFIYNEMEETLSGRFNFGRFGFEHQPTGYKSLYDYYYPQVTPSLPVVVPDPTPSKYTGNRFYAFTCEMYVENKIAPVVRDQHRLPYMKHDKENMDQDYDYDDSYFEMQSRPIVDITTVNFPCPVPNKVYLELNAKDCTLETGYTGLPFTVGITDTTNSIDGKAFTIDLFHILQTTYWTHSYVNGVKTNYPVTQVFTPSAPVQPEIVGFVFDLAGRQIDVYMNDRIFMSVPIKGIDTSHDGDLWYIFFRAQNEVFMDTLDTYKEINRLHGDINFGEKFITYNIPDDVQSFYDYWNDSIRFYLQEPFPGFKVRMKVRPAKSIYRISFSGSVNIEGVNTEWNGFAPGLNVLYSTYNVVTDTEARVNVPLDPFSFKTLMDQHLKENATKKYREYGFPGTLVALNDHYKNYDIYGIVSMGKDLFWDFDMAMDVVKYFVPKNKYSDNIIGLLNLFGNSYVNRMIKGTVTFDDESGTFSDTTAMDIRAILYDTEQDVSVKGYGPILTNSSASKVKVLFDTGRGSNVTNLSGQTWMIVHVGQYGPTQTIANVTWNSKEINFDIPSGYYPLHAKKLNSSTYGPQSSDVEEVLEVLSDTIIPGNYVVVEVELPGYTPSITVPSMSYKTTYTGYEKVIVPHARLIVECV